MRQRVKKKHSVVDKVHWVHVEAVGRLVGFRLLLGQVQALEACVRVVCRGVLSPVPASSQDSHVLVRLCMCVSAWCSCEYHPVTCGRQHVYGTTTHLQRDKDHQLHAMFS